MEKTYRMTRQQKKQEERKMALLDIYHTWEKEHWKVLGIMTGSVEKEKKQKAARQIAEYMIQNQVTVEFISEEELDQGKQIDQADQENELAIVDLMPANRYVRGIELAKQCDAVILVEVFGESRYKDFEENLRLLKENQVAVAGVIV